MKNWFLAFLYFLPMLLSAQKQTSEVMDASGIKKIILTANEVFSIQMKTGAVKEIHIHTKAGGEYAGAIGLISNLQGEKLFLDANFNANLQNGYDKLSAHKVFDIEVEMLIPENIEVEIASNIARVHATGNFKNLQIQLKEGDCKVKGFRGNAVVNTYGANIFFEIKKPAVIEASSRYGTVHVPEPVQTGCFLKLTSISGNINVKKIK